MQELLGNENATWLLLLLRNALQGHRRAQLVGHYITRTLIGGHSILRLIHNENAVMAETTVNDIWLKRNENVLQGQRPNDNAFADAISSTISISYPTDRIVS